MSSRRTVKFQDGHPRPGIGMGTALPSYGTMAGDAPYETIMSTLLQLIEQYGLAAVFFNVLIEQAGVPVPAYPTLVLTGALADQGAYSPVLLLAVAVLGAVIADAGWYLAGRRHGRRILSLLCRMSLSVDTCVRQTETIFARWGAPSLLVAKFVPGFGSVASAMAGATGATGGSFLLFDMLGAALWAGSAIFIGALFSSTVDDLLAVLEQLGTIGLLLIGIALAAFIASKWWQRKLFLKTLRMARISPDELYRLLENGSRPTIIDVRSPTAQQGGRIPGAFAVAHDFSSGLPQQTDPELDEVIVYCACPNEASAAIVARELMKRGYRRVRLLHGGIDAWTASGYSIEGQA